MQINYIPLAAVTEVEEVPSGADFLINDGGVIKKVDSSKIGDGGIPAPDSPSNGDVLTYNSTSDEWEAKAPSGGSSLPAYTSADIGKILTVDASYGDAIMEETTVTLAYNETDDNYQAELTSGFDFSGVSDGDGVFVIYDGNEIYCTASDEDSSIYINAFAISFSYYDGTLTVIGSEGGEVTVALYLADNEHPRLIWKTDGGIK